jgi:hypothetical protein
MAARVSSPPTSARVEIVAGGAAAFAGALVLVTRIDSMPGFVAELLIGFVSVPDFWPMVGGVLLLAAGIGVLLRGRRGVRRYRRALARLESMRERQQLRQPGAGGVSAGVAGTTHRVPQRF